MVKHKTTMETTEMQQTMEKTMVIQQTMKEQTMVMLQTMEKLQIMKQKGMVVKVQEQQLHLEEQVMVEL